MVGVGVGVGGVDNVCFGGYVGDVGDVGYIVLDSFSYF